ncbi:double zinc ribbon domain-containing protein [Halobaculum marinum]|uniref:Zinc ribbon domain-containing protein n=1 Tax=Halobaculum marinum TaxID=3031996 RepID=A0ABD5WVY3_9EURY|nr:zinc ribbon domain-containing protein [Halobaculum sp. DT55]
MSKITFRADADLVDRLEQLEGSKSEVMREALREYLDDAERPSASTPVREAETDSDPSDGPADTLDDALAARVDELVTARLDEALGAQTRDGTTSPRPFGVPDAAPPVNLTVNVDGAGVDVGGASDTATTDGRERSGSDADREEAEAVSPAEATACAQCGEDVSGDHVFCPNCGEKASRRVFCDCGDEVRSDWAFCPGCGRRTPAADVLDR